MAVEINHSMIPEEKVTPDGSGSIRGKSLVGRPDAVKGSYLSVPAGLSHKAALCTTTFAVPIEMRGDTGANPA